MGKEVFEIFQRDNSKITISEFYESYSLGKYNFDPPYQRDYNVWTLEQQSYLIDTIFKNYPMPPIFLETKILKRKSKYDVVDGKQRLTSIVEFINNKIGLPKTFGADLYGNELLNELKIDEIEKLADEGVLIAKKYMDNFWQYKISVEYIENPSTKVVDAVFDRLNRGGARLTPSELRKSSYYDTLMFELIVDIEKIAFWEQLLDDIPNIDKKRLDHHSFLSELVFLLLEDKIVESTEAEIDKMYERWSEILDNATYEKTLEEFKRLTNYMMGLQLDYDKYKVKGVSHIYALWSFIFFCSKEYNFEKEQGEIRNKLDEMYRNYRNKDKDENLEIYRSTMQSGSKKLSQRRRRIIAIADYTGYPLTSNIG